MGDTFQVNGEVDLSPASTGPLQPGAAQLAKDMELRLAITFPGPVSQQSGGTISGKTVTWTPAFGEKTEIRATGSAIGSGGHGALLWLLIGLAILLVVLVALVLIRSLRKRSVPGTGQAVASPTPAPPAPTDPPMQPPASG